MVTAKKSAPALNESVLRVSFLEQAATLLSGAGTPNLVGRLALRELRECAYADQLRMDREQKRTRCKRCFQSWAPGNAQIKLKRAKKGIVRVCGGCGGRTKFATDTRYASRNERAGDEAK